MPPIDKPGKGAANVAPFFSEWGVDVIAVCLKNVEFTGDYYCSATAGELYRRLGVVCWLGYATPGFLTRVIASPAELAGGDLVSIAES